LWGVTLPSNVLHISETSRTPLHAVKRAHIVELERELALIRDDADWWKREDAEWRIVHGSPSA